MTKPTCPSSEELRSLSLGELDEQQSDQISAHLEDCQQCREEIATLDGNTNTFIANLRDLVSENLDQESPFEGEAEWELASQRALAAISGSKHSPSDTSHVPDVIGEYEIIEVLGQGGMGQVFRGQHVKLKRPVAIKFIAKHRMWDQHTHDRFASEMQAIGGLEHSNIVAAHDAREVDGYAVLITEFIDGIDIGELLRRKGPLPVAEACQIAVEICQALEHCDSKGFVHRDIKPSNMMAARSGAVKLLDLGLMKLQTEDQNGGFTATGQAIGTPDYVAPEQVKDSRNVDIRADLYGLGCSLYKMLTGCVPFPPPEFDSAFLKMNAQLSKAPTPILKLRPELSQGLAKLIDQLLQKDPKHRPQTPGDVKQKLLRHSQTANLSEFVQNALELPESDFFPQQTKAQVLASAKTARPTPEKKTTTSILKKCWESAPVRACRWGMNKVVGLLTQSNIPWMVIAGLYVLLTPLLFLEADPFNISLVVLHGLFTGWKLKREQAAKTIRSAFRSALSSGVLVYGFCGLLIASQARSCLQDAMFQHPYFLAPIWDELWFAPIAMLPFAVIALTFFFAVKPAKFSFWRVSLFVVGWATIVVLLAYFFYDIDRFVREGNPLTRETPIVWGFVALALLPVAAFFLIKRGELTRWRPVFYTMAWLCFVAMLPLCLGGIENTQRRFNALNLQHTATEESSVSSSQPRTSAREGNGNDQSLVFVQSLDQLKKLAQLAWTNRLQDTGPWYRELDKFLQQPTGWDAVRVYDFDDPEFAALIDQHLRQKYDLPVLVKDPDKAWSALEQLGRECVHDVELERVVTMVAPAVDLQQLHQQLVKHKPMLQADGLRLKLLHGGGRVTFGQTADPRAIPLRPLIKTVMLLEEEHQTKHSDQYSPLKNNFSRLAYRSTPPLPQHGYHRIRTRGQAMDEESGFTKTLEMLRLNSWKWDVWPSPDLSLRGLPGVKQAPQYDDYLLRRRAWSLAWFDDSKLVNTTIDGTTKQLLFRRSPAAKKWRTENREWIMEITHRSIAERAKTLSEEERELLDAFPSILSNGANSPLNGLSLQQLEFLFLDQPVDNQPSLAMEFWPKLDQLLYEVPGHPHKKISLRIRYLEKIWPQSTPEMFADTYFKAHHETRQSFLVDQHSTGLSEIIPVAGRVRILREIEQRVKPSTPGGIYWNRDNVTKSEAQTIQIALSKLDCPAGAAAFLELHADQLRKVSPRSLYPVGERNPGSIHKIRWRDDLFDLLTKHSEPEFRKIALYTIQNRPMPRFIKALPALQSDPDASVRELAEEVAKQIESYTWETYRKEYPSENESPQPPEPERKEFGSGSK